MHPSSMRAAFTPQDPQAQSALTPSALVFFTLVFVQVPGSEALAGLGQYFRLTRTPKKTHINEYFSALARLSLHFSWTQLVLEYGKKCSSSL